MHLLVLHSVLFEHWQPFEKIRCVANLDYLPCFHAGPVLSDFECRGTINLELPDQ